MDVYRVRAFEEFLHHRVAVVDGQREEADGRADAVAPADPIPEAEDVVLVDPEGGGRGNVGRNGAHVMGDDIRLRSFASAFYTIWLPYWRLASSQRFRERAFSIVSAVVNVFETITTRVLSGSIFSTLRAMSRGSTLATKWSSRP